MKDTVFRLLLIHLAVVALVAVGSAIVWGAAASWSALTGTLCFSIPLVAFSVLVLRASSGEPTRFWGRFMTAELLKWVSSGTLLALAFVSGAFVAAYLLGGFLVSVLVQVFFPIFVRKESHT